MPLQGAPSCDDVELNREVPLAENGPNPEKVDRAMLVRSRLSRILFLRKFFDYPVSLSWNTIRNLGPVRMTKMGFSYLASIPSTNRANKITSYTLDKVNVHAMTIRAAVLPLL